MCALQAHVALCSQALKYFDGDDAKNAKVKAPRGIVRHAVFHTERGDLLDILERPNPDRYGGSAYLHRPVAV